MTGALRAAVCLLGDRAVSNLPQCWVLFSDLSSGEELLSLLLAGLLRAGTLTRV